MSRSGYSYSYDCENLHLYRGTVARALGGRRGQRALREMAVALDAMPVKELGCGSFQAGSPCTLGALAAHRGVDVSDLEPEDPDYPEVDRDLVGARFDVAPQMAAEVMFENDEQGLGDEAGAQRWARMRAWVGGKIREGSPS